LKLVPVGDRQSAPAPGSSTPRNAEEPGSSRWNRPGQRRVALGCTELTPDRLRAVLRALSWSPRILARTLNVSEDLVEAWRGGSPRTPRSERGLLSAGGRAVGDNSEVFVGLDVANARHTVAIAEGRRDEVRCSATIRVESGRQSACSSRDQESSIGLQMPRCDLLVIFQSSRLSPWRSHMRLIEPGRLDAILPLEFAGHFP
jgi:hypothetical protein